MWDTHTGQAQWLHHPNQSNLGVRIVTAMGHCSWRDFTPGKGTEVRISMQGGGVQRGRGPHNSTVLLHQGSEQLRGRREGLLTIYTRGTQMTNDKRTLQPS